MTVTSLGEDKEHHIIPQRFSISPPFFLPGRARLAIERKSVMPISILVSIYGHLSYLVALSRLGQGCHQCRFEGSVSMMEANICLCMGR